jgi:undecaprenyl diphosphate synthase
VSQAVIPNHIGIIMDGNRRWAKAHDLSANQGHKKGLDTLVEVVGYAKKKNIKHLTVYAFSTENWNRKPKEVKYLMNLVAAAIRKYLKRLNQESVKILFLGDKNGIDENISKILEEAENTTKSNEAITLCACFNYGGQNEIVHAVKKIIQKDVQVQDVTEDTISENLFAPDVPPVDIMVRTSGEQRISNFMLWRIAYSELMFVNKHWPDFDKNDLDEVIKEYSKRQRRFGG